MYMCHLTSFNVDIKNHTTIILRYSSAINYEGTINVYICMHTVISYGTLIFAYYSINHTSLTKLLIARCHPKTCCDVSSLWYLI